MALLWPDPMTPINFFNRMLVRDTIGECQHPLRSVHWRLGTEERQDRSYEDRAPSGYASNSDYGAADKKARLRVNFCFHCKWELEASVYLVLLNGYIVGHIQR